MKGKVQSMQEIHLEGPNESKKPRRGGKGGVRWVTGLLLFLLLPVVLSQTALYELVKVKSFTLTLTEITRDFTAKNIDLDNNKDRVVGILLIDYKTEKSFIRLVYYSKDGIFNSFQIGYSEDDQFITSFIIDESNEVIIFGTNHGNLGLFTLFLNDDDQMRSELEGVIEYDSGIFGNSNTEITSLCISSDYIATVSQGDPGNLNNDVRFWTYGEDKEQDYESFYKNSLLDTEGGEFYPFSLEGVANKDLFAAKGKDSSGNVKVCLFSVKTKSNKLEVQAKECWKAAHGNLDEVVFFINYGNLVTTGKGVNQGDPEYTGIVVYEADKGKIIEEKFSHIEVKGARFPLTHDYLDTWFVITPEGKAQMRRISTGELYHTFNLDDSSAQRIGLFEKSDDFCSFFRNNKNPRYLRFEFHSVIGNSGIGHCEFGVKKDGVGVCYACKDDRTLHIATNIEDSCVSVTTSTNGFFNLNEEIEKECVNEENFNICDYNCQSPTPFIDTTGTPKCVNSCPNGSTSTPSSGICQPCAGECDGCLSSPTECIRCSSANQYFSEGACLDCHSNCLTCFGGQSKDCLLCQPSLIFNNNNCILQCANQFGIRNYNGVDICASCSNSNCKECFNNYEECELCKDLDHYVKDLNRCVSDCGEGYLIDGAVCRECHESCKTCSGFTENECTSCDHYLYQNQCVYSCPNGYVGFQNKCEACSESQCLTCELISINAPEDKCTRCNENFVLQGAQCLTQCNSGYYKSDESICEPCDSNCLECLNSPTNCEKCHSPRLLDIEDRVCYDECPVSKYQIGNLCKKCEAPCGSCALDPLNCLTCADPGYRLVQHFSSNNECVPECPEGYFETTSTNGIEECQRCYNKCKTCSGNKFNECITCIDAYFFVPALSTCSDICPSETFKNMATKICEDCSNGCVTCTNESTCTRCGTSFFLYQDECYNQCPEGTIRDYASSTCIDCDQNCLTCQIDISRCISCIPSMILVEDQNRCVDRETGLEGYYEKGGVLVPCKQPCLNCFEEEKFCSDCIQGYEFKDEVEEKDKKCRLVCDPGYAWVPPNNCVPCSRNCLECLDESLECTNCEDPFKISLNNARWCIEVQDRKLIIVMKYFQKKKFIAKIKFKENIYKQDWENILWVTLGDMKRDTNGEKKTFEYKIRPSDDGHGLDISLEFFTNFESLPLIVHNTSNGNFKAGYYQEAQYREPQIEIGKISHFNSKLTGTIQSAENPSQTSIKSVTATTAVASASFGASVVKMFQMFDILKFFNIETPQNYNEFMKIFESSIFDIIPNFIPKIDEVGMCDLNERLKESDLDCYILNSSGGVIGQVFGYGVIKLIFSSLRLFISSLSKNGFVSRIITRINNGLSLAFFVELLLAVFIDVSTAAFANLRSFWVYPFAHFINSLVSLLIILLYFFLLHMIIWNSLKLEVYRKITGDYIDNDSKQELKNWAFLKNDLKKKLTPFGGFVNQILFLRDFLTSFFIIIFVENFYGQMVPVVTMNILCLAFLIVYRPYESLIMNFLIIFNQVSFLAILLLLFFLKIREGSITEERKYKVFGTLMIISIAFAVAVNMLVCVFEVILSLKELVGKCLKKKASVVKPAGKIKASNESLDNSRADLNSQEPVNMVSIPSSVHKYTKNPSEPGMESISGNSGNENSKKRQKWGKRNPNRQKKGKKNENRAKPKIDITKKVDKRRSININAYNKKRKRSRM